MQEEGARETLDEVRSDLGECTRCKLHKGRKKIVFGVGNPRSKIVFVGEGPGADEDEQGFPFVGRAGQLLTRMLKALGVRREDVYICNVVKCRPPNNRAPEPDEVTACSPFLLRQIHSIRPAVVCALGSAAMQTLLKSTGSITKLRGQVFEWEGTKLIPTFHPAYLLRNPRSEWEARADLKKALDLAGVTPLGR
ncbi:MAG: uracil-DNA glycosylase [Nitrospirae bacterium]|nr:uracil-DNA glycosylase [Nitrospirota bacterium]